MCHTKCWDCLIVLLVAAVGALLNLNNAYGIRVAAPSEMKGIGGDDPLHPCFMDSDTYCPGWAASDNVDCTRNNQVCVPIFATDGSINSYKCPCLDGTCDPFGGDASTGIIVDPRGVVGGWQIGGYDVGWCTYSTQDNWPCAWMFYCQCSAGTHVCVNPAMKFQIPSDDSSQRARSDQGPDKVCPAKCPSTS
jgi:hypothetical protein